MKFLYTAQGDKVRKPLSEGFTLIEMLITIFIYGLITIGAAQAILMMFQGSNLRLNSLSSVDQVRFAGTRFSNEMRDAQSGQDGSFAIGEASTSEVIFYTQYGASAGLVNRMRYFVASSTLYRAVTVPTGSPLAYHLASESITPIVNNVVASTTSAFTYYSGSYAGTSSPITQPVNLTLVTFVKMNLQVLIQDVRSATTSYAFSVGSAVRSLKTNLGN